MNYAAARRYLDSYINYESAPLNTGVLRSFNLERVERVLHALGDPHKDLPVVHIAGTKGKGSTATLVCRALVEAGHRVGLYTQPHLLSPRERFQINGACISQEALAALVTELRPVFDQLRDSSLGHLTFYEVYTAMAFAYFARAQLDIAVLEVGMGGRLDATNVVDPVVTVITPIGIDHVDALGETLEAIAGEKAGIIKPARPVIVARQEALAEGVIRDVARRCDAPVVDVRSGVRTKRQGVADRREVCDLEGYGISLRDVRLKLVGAHQVANAATALATLQCLRGQGWAMTDTAVRAGLEQARIHGRFQLVDLADGRQCVLDAAHTPGSAEALAHTLGEVYSEDRVTLIVGMSSDKDAGGFAHALAPIASHVVLTRAESSPRASDPDDLAVVFERHFDAVSVEPSLQAAVSGAPGSALCVTGSVYIVGEALRAVAPEAYAKFRREVDL